MSISHNMYIMSLLEAAKDKDEKKKKSDATEDDQVDAASEAEEPATEEGDTNETEETDDTADDSTEEQNPGDENQDEEKQSEDENPEEGQDQDASDDFSLDSDTPDDSTDNDPPPDGLVDPDDDGSTDEEDPDAETNVHVNILSLSKLDRTLAKRRCLNDYYDLRTSIDTVRNIIDRNEAVVEPETRARAVEQLNKLYTTVSEYLMYKFAYSNYEDALQHYLLFMRAINDIVQNVKENGLNRK